MGEQTDRRDYLPVDNRSTVLGYMPQYFNRGDWQDALNRCVSSLAPARAALGPWAGRPVRIVERIVVDGVVEGFYGENEPSCLRCLGSVRGNHCTNCGRPAFTSPEHPNG